MIFAVIRTSSTPPCTPLKAIIGRASICHTVRKKAKGEEKRSAIIAVLVDLGKGRRGRFQRQAI
jgi:hypothetical protein